MLATGVAPFRECVGRHPARARISLVSDEQNVVRGLVLTMGGQDQEAAKVGAP